MSLRGVFDEAISAGLLRKASAWQTGRNDSLHLV